MSRRLAGWVPIGLITALGLLLLWPIPAGHMPLSADHTVHLTRIWMWAQELASGSLRGWSPIWFFGVPVGELYPVAGDALIIGVRVLSLGLLDWGEAYALGFSLVFLLQGWALLFAARRLGFGTVAGTAAGMLILADVGQYREGGWIYTVQYGVWPQSLGTALLWWGLAELTAALDVRSPTGDDRKALGRAGLLLGVAILAHPMTLPAACVSGLILVLTFAARDPARARATLSRSLIAAALGLAVGAWWLIPMLQHRGWMASYGWLFMPVQAMVREALDGSLAQNVVAPVTLLAAAGVAGAFFDRRGSWRFVAGTSVVLWFLASSDAFWSFRLDRVSEGFTHLQYQRFLSAAKPGFFLLAGASIGFLARRCTTGASVMRVVAGMAVAGMLSWTAAAQWRAGVAAGVGRPELQRFGDDVARAAAYDELSQWLGTSWEQRDGFWRVAVRASRNLHWFMDAPVGSGVPLYKMGFTPGDNFVHKPESRRQEVLDALGVRYLIQERAGAAGPGETRSFGPFAVTERVGAGSYQPAWIRGAGTVVVEELDLEAGVLRGTIAGTDSASRLVLGVAGYPRWELRMGDELVQWVETPVWGDGPDATQEDRRSGTLRGGKVHGDDGSEPTLMAASARDGTFELRYRSTRVSDLLAMLASLLAAAACAGLVFRPAAAQRFVEPLQVGLQRALHPAVVSGMVLAVALSLGVRWSRAASQEHGQATAWVADGRAVVTGRMFTAPLKADMLIRPAVHPRHGTSQAVFSGLTPRTVVTGWAALDDDSTKLGRKGQWSITAEARPVGGDWGPAHELTLPHRPGLTPLRVPTPTATAFDLRITTRSIDRPPDMGFDLDLEASP